MSPLGPAARRVARPCRPQQAAHRPRRRAPGWLLAQLSSPAWLRFAVAERSCHSFGEQGPEGQRKTHSERALQGLRLGERDVHADPCCAAVSAVLQGPAQCAGWSGWPLQAIGTALTKAGGQGRA